MKPYLIVKSILDFIFSLIFLFIASPIMVFAAIAIKIEDPKGPVFFKQQRAGKDAKLFKVYKFRTMIVETERNGKLLSDMERMTKVGSFLRKISLDEIPQIFNILRGEMSFIGPRPLLVRYLELYSQEQMRRHEVIPGISGWAQVNGRNTISWEQKFEYDVWYVDNQSFFIDLKIVFLTIISIFSNKDINSSKEDTMPAFNGSKDYVRGQMNMENIMFCSVGRRAELMKIFRSEFEGIGTTIAADNSNTAPALYIADKQYIVPRINDKNYISTILEICRKENIKAITTLIDPEISILAKNRDHFTENGVMVLGSSYEVSEICFDKYKTYQFLKENGFKCAKTYNSIEKFKLAYNLGEIEFPVFAKPNNGSGSVGIKKIYTFNELNNVAEDSVDYIIQEFMDGIEYDADVYVDMLSGELVSAFTKKKMSSRIGGADKTISYKDDNLFKLINRFVNTLGLTGPINIDFFQRDGEYYISEINPRFGGGYIHAHACGVNFPKLILNNIKGISNEKQIGNFEEDVVMMMYDSLVIKRADELTI